MNEIEAIKSMRNLDDVISITETEHESVKMAISALEKQIPKKVYKTNIPKGKFVYSCPSCGRIYQSGFDIGTKYCDECGQKLNWSEDTK